LPILITGWFLLALWRLERRLSHDIAANASIQAYRLPLDGSSMDLKHANVVITGASSGIGRATALEMARRGANLVLAARRTEALEQVAAQCRVLGVRATAVTADVSSPGDCQGLIETAGTVDVLVNNAGFAVLGTITEIDPAETRAMMDTNYFGTVHCTRAVLPQMLARGRGTIVNVASILGIMGVAGMSDYCATKFAIVGFTEGLRDEVVGKGVRVALVCPGTTDTEFFVRADRNKMPGASQLMPAVKPERVARAVCDAAEDGRYRRILPLLASSYMRFKELSPRVAHALFRSVSGLLERR
jgi:short-subunit dehydrogenase